MRSKEEDPTPLQRGCWYRARISFRGRSFSDHDFFVAGTDYQYSHSTFSAYDDAYFLYFEDRHHGPAVFRWNYGDPESLLTSRFDKIPAEEATARKGG